MTPRITVVVPCRNHGHLLAEAVDSILRQGMDAVDVIVVDDSSSDDTVAIAGSRGARLVPSRGRGAAAARNTGVASTATDLIAFLDADDVWPADSLRTRISALDGHDAAFGAVEEFLDPGLTGAAPVPRRVGPTRMAGSVVLTRHAWTVVGPMDEQLVAGEFIDWMARFETAGLRAAAVDDVVLRRRLHDSNSTRGAGSSVAAHLLEVARLQRQRSRR